jgi:hypothetical protein
MAAAKKPAARKKTTISSPGKPPVSFTPGGLHTSTGTPPGQKIPAAKLAAAAAGKFGPKAVKQAALAKGMLAAGRKTAASNRKSK